MNTNLQHTHTHTHNKKHSKRRFSLYITFVHMSSTATIISPILTVYNTDVTDFPNYNITLYYHKQIFRVMHTHTAAEIYLIIPRLLRAWGRISSHIPRIQNINIYIIYIYYVFLRKVFVLQLNSCYWSSPA